MCERWIFFREFIDTKGYIWLPHANAKCKISLYCISRSNAKCEISHLFARFRNNVYNCVWLCIIVYNCITFCKILAKYQIFACKCEISNFAFRDRKNFAKFCIYSPFAHFKKKFMKFCTSLVNSEMGSKYLEFNFRGEGVGASDISIETL